MSTVFICYSRNDAEVVDKLSGIITKLGHTVWIDREGIRGGDQWRARIANAIQQCDIFVIALSPNSTASQVVRKELNLAADERKQIVPVCIAPTEIPIEMKLQLAGLQRIDCIGDLESCSGVLEKAIGLPSSAADWTTILSKVELSLLSITPTEAQNGTKVTLYYHLRSDLTASIVLWLGASLVDCGSSEFWNVREDVEVELVPGSTIVSRSLTVPGNAALGQGYVVGALWFGPISDTRGSKRLCIRRASYSLRITNPKPRDNKALDPTP